MIYILVDKLASDSLFRNQLFYFLNATYLKPENKVIEK